MTLAAATAGRTLRAARLLLGWLALPLCLAAAGPAHAEGTPAPNCSPLSLTAARLEARKLLDNADQDPDRASRVRSLEAAYRIFQDPVILYNLGTLWYGAGRKVEGADLLRRYLYEAGAAVTTERRDKLAKMLSRLGKGTGELVLNSEPCAFVYVDRRLVGRVPLSLPLLLRGGAHVIEVEKDHRKNRVEVAMGTGQRSLQVRLPASVVLLAEGIAGAEAERLLSVAADGAAMEGLTPVTGKARDAILNRTAPLRGCLNTQGCQEELAKLVQAQYVLVLRVEPGDGSKLSAHLVDVEASAESVAQTTTCPNCDPELRAQRLSGLGREVLRAGLSIARGTLEVTSVPEAEVAVDGRKLGKTPFLRSALAGAHQLELSAVGYRPHTAPVQVEDGKRTALEVMLKVEGEQSATGVAAVAVPFTPPPPPPVKTPEAVVAQQGGERLSRPRWRLALGGVTTALGLGLTALGGMALAVDGQCGPASMPSAPPAGQMCAQVYHTQGPGGAMVGVGVSVLVAGIVTLAWPGPIKE